MSMRRLLQAVQVEAIIVGLKEAGAAVVAPLQGVLQDAGKDEARSARHR